MNKILSQYGLISLITLFLLNFTIIGNAAPPAGIKLPQTRVIFNSKDKNALATIQNQGDNVYLVKASALNDTSMNSEIAPFAVTPPLFRLEPRNQQTVRVVRQGTGQLPVDRESVLYLSFLAIPSITEISDAENRVAIGLQTVIKLFYRPEQLAITAEQAAKKLTFRLSGKQLIAENPTPYYLTLGSLRSAGKPVSFGETGQMIAPFSQATYPFESLSKEVTWTVINDYGGLSTPYQATLAVDKGSQ
ncbi:molecular chaperone [Klebsiella sp. BIGb0407]|uniref:fimbrial biogenesis chaperone n=1 Tax=Klebsiella sp. BIGb0407 TaxID=2940603 RepID=UPI002168EB3A|nr:molecular chaperone [Klebsiella sp. BIGb0407]MCS3429511.1 P pilus assembly chaperone PapD [Klebsiella sp. BIGb0407]